MGAVECVAWLLKVHTGEQRLIAGQWKKSTGSPDELPPSVSWVRHVNQWPNDKVIQHLEGRTCPCDEDPRKAVWDEMYSTEQLHDQVKRGVRPDPSDIVNSLFARVRDEEWKVVKDMRWVRAIQVWNLPQFFQDYGSHFTAKDLYSAWCYAWWYQQGTEATRGNTDRLKWRPSPRQ